MNQHDIISDNRIFGYLAIATFAALCVPFVATLVSDDVNWDIGDFVVMGALLFGLSSAYVLLARLIAPKLRMVAAIVFVVIFLYIWAELAVGVFTGLGS